jgi:hypothetical protein
MCPICALPRRSPLSLAFSGLLARGYILKSTVGPVGIEPTTRGLKVRCSTN